MCSHSKWDEIDFTCLVVNWRLCANKSALEVSWNFTVEKILEKNPSAEKL